MPPKLANAVEHGTLQQLVFHLRCCILQYRSRDKTPASLLTPEVARAAFHFSMPEHKSDALWLLSLLLAGNAKGTYEQRAQSPPLLTEVRTGGLRCRRGS